MTNPVRPTEPNTPQGILGAWIALEALSPQTYRAPRDLAVGQYGNVAELGDGPLPWERAEKSRPGHQLYYQIILGSVPMERATDDLITAFGTTEEQPSRSREKAALAAVMIDRNGCLLENEAIAVSSFGWALPLALQLKLEALSAWPTVEREVVEKLRNILGRKDDDDNALPVTQTDLTEAFEYLVGRFSLPAHLADAPHFALRVFHNFKAKNPPEPALLNSFFMHDLAQARTLDSTQSLPKTMRQYLGLEPPAQSFDLLHNKSAVERAVAPVRIPASRWPSPGGHPLVLLQQTAVNLARDELLKDGGVIAVNGPPGTGKTTLLRDIVAATVLDRALAMAEFDTPADAFKPSGQKWSVGGQAFFTMYKLDPTLRGHEIVVASSNNKAVENISRELPDVHAVGRADSLCYFRSISDNISQASQKSQDDNQAKENLAPLQTWGMIAAVLGNAKNRGLFSEAFWWDDDNGFRTYLKAAKGDDVTKEVVDPDTKKVIKRTTPSVIAKESPPVPKQAAQQWSAARGKLVRLHREILDDLSALEGVRQKCLELAKAKDAVAQRLQDRDVSARDLARAQSQQHILEANTGLAQMASERAEQDLRQHRKARPNLWRWLFNAEARKSWRTQNKAKLDAKAQTDAALHQARQAEHANTRTIDQLRLELTRLDRDVLILNNQVAELDKALDPYRAQLGHHLVDGHFFERSHEAINLQSPWLPAALQRKREDLFIAAMETHKAFIDAAAQKVLHNLSVLMNLFGKAAPEDPEKRALLPDLWATLFMVVPVVSTTFASMERMFGALPAESLGWLLVDEAGQALPQAAVGGLLRAKRALIVGDPLQIPPVVSLPERLNDQIADYFKIDSRLWTAPEASAQTLADRVSPYQAAFRTDTGPRRVGIPLLVHRRCQEPMFGISNRIAYDGQMVHAASGKQGLVSAALGPSAWFDVDGDADTKWCPAEGEYVIGLLHRIAAAGIRNPDIFIITPFRIVAQQLRARLQKESDLFARLGEQPKSWLEDRVGTIHTVQGREAEAVIMVLGAPKSSQNGARVWASSTPNILNVAVSRAKQNFYVVGSHGAWSGIGHSKALADALPIR